MLFNVMDIFSLTTFFNAISATVRSSVSTLFQFASFVCLWNLSRIPISQDVFARVVTCSATKIEAFDNCHTLRE